jgi:phage/plasmid-like protein (TIGR03299 family)
MHELEMDANGNASMIYVGETPWHRLGTPVSPELTVAEALEKCRADYTVEAQPVFLRRPVDITEYEDAVVEHGAVQVLPPEREGELPRLFALRESGITRAVVRTDTGAELGRVSLDYVPVQNRDAFRVLEPLVEGGLARVETGGVLRDGRDAWLLVQFDRSKLGGRAGELFAEENIAAYGLVRTNHSGRASILVANTPIRVVCANTLGMVENGAAARALSVRHRGDAEARLVDAAKLVFEAVFKGWEGIAEQYERLRGYYMDTAMFRKLVLDVAVPHPSTSPRFNPDARTAESVVRRAEAKRSRLLHLWTGGKGHVGDYSAWEAYNAVVEGLDHDERLFPSRGGAWRLGSLMDGQLAQTKVSVLNALNRAIERGELQPVG